MGRHKDRTGPGRFRRATDVMAERGEEGIARLLGPTGGHGTRAVLEAVGHMHHTAPAKTPAARSAEFL